MKKRKIKLSRLMMFLLGGFLLVTGIAYVITSKMSFPEELNSTPPPYSEERYIHENWNENKRINNEYIGDVVFESGLVFEKIVQGSDNEKYLNLSWDLKESSQGSVFLDYRNTLDDQNIILYGHYVYKDETLIFGPLHNLIKEENYKGNSQIRLNFEEQQWIYEITNVFYYEMGNPTLEYFRTNYEEKYFELYYENVKKHSFYDTAKELTVEDHFLTLQTCVRNRDDLRLIIIAKRIDS